MTRVLNWLTAISCVLSIGTDQAMYWQFLAKDLPTWRYIGGAVSCAYCCWCLKQVLRANEAGSKVGVAEGRELT